MLAFQQGPLEEYVTRRRLEKKVAATTYGKGSKSHSHRNSKKIEVRDNKASSSTKGLEGVVMATLKGPKWAQLKS
ncbi:unnamed protein product [Lupinus luteus]|uniref:Uncharacterized protein n=1 Tax=Lupinus luteus TaxID=3873 RepID=A0AAV1WU29_LUPLU